MDTKQVEENLVNKSRLIRRRRVFFIRRIVFIFLLFIIFLLVFMNSPIFDIKNLNVIGNKMLSEDYVREELNGIFHKNIFFDFMKVKSNSLNENKYIESVKYVKKYPNTINVVIKERNVDYYIYSNGSYYIFDRESRLIDILDSKPNIDIVEIKGIKIFPELKLDQNLFQKGSREIQWMENLGELFNLNKSNIKFDYVNLSNVHNVVLGYKNIQIKIGSNSELKDKLNIAINTIESNENIKNMTGYIDVRSKNYPVIFFEN